VKCVDDKSFLQILFSTSKLLVGMPLTRGIQQAVDAVPIVGLIGNFVQETKNAFEKIMVVLRRSIMQFQQALPLAAQQRPVDA
jgi:hypothetical protein